MLFNSLAFLVFFPVVAILYFVIPSLKWKNMFLLVASYYFYMNWEPTYALLLLTSTAITYFAAIGIDKYKQHRKTFLVVSLVLNLSILFFYKYYNWLASDVADLLNYCGLSIHIPEFKVLLPVGISFYIFQALGYSIDVYRGDTKVEKNFFRYALFVSFFPQLVAGPIERSTNLMKQFYKEHKFNGADAVSGLNLMLWGYFLKLVVADRMAIYVDAVYNNMPHHNGASILLATVMFCFQLYGDFAGYSYIAIGCARVMGFKLMTNFKRPYFFALSIQDFWKRWHISLTTWFMDYVYYPMVGNSMKLSWWCFCIFFIFFLSGFWHGAAWTYVLCFSIFGFYMVVCALKEKRQRKFEKKYKLKDKGWWLWLNRFLTAVLVCFALIFFRANNLPDSFTAVGRIFTEAFSTQPNLMEVQHVVFAIIAVVILFCVEYCIEFKKVKVTEANAMRTYIITSSLLLVVIVAMGVFDGGQFIYFQF